MNLTDGLDGLAAGASAMVFGAYTLITFIQSRNTCGTDRRICPAATWCATRSTSRSWPPRRWPPASGSCGGTRRPAQIFMGDTGSMALGGLMAGMAILSRTELLLVVLGGLFAVVTLSGIIQTGWFKYTRRRTGDRTTRVQDVADPPPLRAVRLARGDDHRAVLDHRRARRRVRHGVVLRRVHRPWLTAAASGRTVLVCGVRVAGEAAARALLARGARVLLRDR